MLLVSAAAIAFLKEAGSAGFGVSKFLETLQPLMIINKVTALNIVFIFYTIFFMIIPVPIFCRHAHGLLCPDAFPRVLRLLSPAGAGR